jgi:pyruvate, water dikinase
MINSLISEAMKTKEKVEANMQESEEEMPKEKNSEKKDLQEKKKTYEKTSKEKPDPRADPKKNVVWFSEINKDSGNVAGGKGANLAEIYNLGIKVPPGFIVTAQAYNYFIKEAGIKEKIEELLERIDYENTKQLDEITKQIRAFIEDSQFSKELEEEILEAYENLDTSNFSSKEKDSALDILKAGAEPIFVAVRSSATAEDLAGASFAGQQDTYLNIKGKKELLKHVKKCFASLYTSRATYYRNKKGFEHSEVSLAVVVQKMVDSEKSGVMFSKDPSYKNNNTIIEAVWGLGEGIVSGKITPDKYVVSENLEIIDKKIATKRIAITRDSSGAKTIVRLKEEIAKAQVLKEHEIKILTQTAERLEEHYSKPQDIEFAIENGEIYIVQTRPITTLENRRDEKAQEIKGNPILTGLAASPGIASGKIKIIEDLEDLDKIKPGDILVTEMTNPDMVVAMQKSAAIVTNEGGLTAHAAIVSREMGIPCIVGTDEATTILKEGEIITVDGFHGKIYRGKVAETVQKEVLPVTAETKTQIKVIVDLPSYAERAAKTNLKKVGLTRIEGIIAESGKHPKFFLDQDKINQYQEIIYKGIQAISLPFEEIWVRTSDIRSDEFENLEGAPKEKEANPMLGFHGIRYSLKNPEILKAELKAMNQVAQHGKSMGILIPQLISVNELKKVKEILSELKINQIKIGIMVETPAAVQLIRDLCEEGIDFISFGTNDLTQYLLAVDRGNEEVQDLYDEMHPAVLYQLGYVIRVCKRHNIETSICGQAGSKKPMVKYLVEQGIDSISVNADAAKEISDYIAQIEQELVKGTDKEPRQYQPPEKQESKEKPIEQELSNQNEDEELLGQKSESETIEDLQEKEIEQTTNTGIANQIQETVEKVADQAEELVEEFIDSSEPSEEEEMYHQTLKQPKEFTNEELPSINGVDSLAPEEDSEDEILDVF